MTEKKFSKLTRIKELEEGGSISDIFVIKAKSSVQPYSNNSKYYFSLILSDKSGDIEAKYWGGNNKDAVESLQESLKSTDVVHVIARVQLYHNELQLSISDSNLTKLSKEEYDANFFIEESKEDLEQLYSNLLATIEQIKDSNLKQLCLSFYQCSNFKRAFSKLPATKNHHHAYLGGLLESTHNIVCQCKNISKIHPNLSNDLLLSIALLAPIGKIETLLVSTTIEYSRSGSYLGDLAQAYSLVEKRIESVCPNIAPILKLKLLNGIISQQARLSWGAAKKPVTAEAFVYSRIKELDANLDYFIQEQEKDDSGAEFVFSKDFGYISKQ